MAAGTCQWTNGPGLNGLRDIRLAIFVLPVILLIFYINAAMHFRYTPDDTYIYLQFARNLINGDGIAFNPGQPTYGVTGPAWMGLIAVGGLLKIDLLLAAKIIDLFLASMALMLFFFVAYEVIRDLIVSLLATLAFAMNVWFLRWAGTGMETSLATLLVLAVIWFSLRNEYFPAVVLTALAGLVRPECWLLLPLILTDVYVNSIDPQRAMKMIISLGAIFVALVTPWFIFAWITFGTVIPNTALAKSTPGFQPGATVDTVIDIIRTLTLSDGISGTVLVLGVFFLWYRHRALAALSLRGEEPAGNDAAINFYLFRSAIVPLGWVILLCALYCLRGVNVVSRYLVPVSSVLVIFAFAIFHRVVLVMGRMRTPFTAAIILAAAIMMQNQVSYMVIVKPGIAAFEQGMEQCFIPMGKWFNNNTPPGSVVFAEDIGALGYYAQRPICDAAGLISTAPLQILRKGGTMDDMYRDRFYLQCGASYVVHRASSAVALHDSLLQPLFTREIEQISLSATAPMYYTVYQVRSPRQPPSP